MPDSVRPVCKRCLLADVDVDGLYKKVSELIELMPEDIRADSELYSYRLEICKRCDSLENGICRECGCLVELRAAARRNYCPRVYKLWNSVENVGS